VQNSLVGRRLLPEVIVWHPRARCPCHAR
jgi:hypothetical protein